MSLWGSLGNPVALGTGIPREAPRAPKVKIQKDGDKDAEQVLRKDRLSVIPILSEAAWFFHPAVDIFEDHPVSPDSSQVCYYRLISNLQ